MLIISAIAFRRFGSSADLPLTYITLYLWEVFAFHHNMWLYGVQPFVRAGTVSACMAHAQIA
jgi:hypothetical protein